MNQQSKQKVTKLLFKRINRLIFSLITRYTCLKRKHKDVVCAKFLFSGKSHYLRGFVWFLLLSL
ncbi:Uncharacterised protein [Vibrio cholerae]|nr:Uncharacterised protein [Vibrio cholerae]